VTRGRGTPDNPEGLPAARRDQHRHPETALAAACRSHEEDLSATDKWAIAAKRNDLPLVRRPCVRGFAPFIDEVECHIRPLS